MEPHTREMRRLEVQQQIVTRETDPGTLMTCSVTGFTQDGGAIGFPFTSPTPDPPQPVPPAPTNTLDADAMAERTGTQARGPSTGCRRTEALEVGSTLGEAGGGGGGDTRKRGLHVRPVGALGSPRIIVPQFLLGCTPRHQQYLHDAYEEDSRTQ